MKKIFVFLFIFILNLMIENVKAKDGICVYEGTFKESKVSASITIFSDEKYNSLPFYTFSIAYIENGDTIVKKLNIYNYSYEFTGNTITWTKLYNDNNKTLREYYFNNGQACPPYLAIYRTNPTDGMATDTMTDYGVLSDFNKPSTSPVQNDPVFFLDLLNPAAEDLAPDNATDNAINVCEVNFLLKYNNGYEEKIRIDYTLSSANKTVTSSNAVIITDTSKFFSNNSSCLEKVYACVYPGMVGKNSNSHPIFLASDQDSMKKNIFQTLINYDLIHGTNIGYKIENYEEFCPDNDCNFETDMSAELSLSCSEVSAVPSELATLEAGKGGCPPFQDLIDVINDNKYGSASDEISKLKTFCSSIVKYGTYTSKKSSCMYRCLNINKEIKALDFNNNGQCGFSGRLILWIANIIRWVKYIVPVAVIVLGILDFMKAISADKEDEMKKAQQRFIRRLIASTLIFIVPFIIEFILNKLGFAANGCGIINL